MRLALGISYRGQAYQGWQSQPSGRTVQDLLEAALTVEHPYNAGLMQEAWVAATRQVFARTTARP